MPCIFECVNVQPSWSQMLNQGANIVSLHLVLSVSVRGNRECRLFFPAKAVMHIQREHISGKSVFYSIHEAMWHTAWSSPEATERASVSSASGL